MAQLLRNDRGITCIRILKELYTSYKSRSEKSESAKSPSVTVVRGDCEVTVWGRVRVCVCECVCVCVCVCVCSHLYER